MLISTDVASRGLDFFEVTHTILYDLPSNVVEYTNRIGRTARIGIITNKFYKKRINILN